MEGIKDFSKEFDGELITETMLVRGLNDEPELAEKVAEFIAELNARPIYQFQLGLQPRNGLPANEETLEIWREIFSEKIEVECIVVPEGDFTCTGNLEEDLLSILYVLPMCPPHAGKFFEKVSGKGQLKLGFH